MRIPPPCKRLRQSGSFLEMSSIGAMEECLRRFESLVASPTAKQGKHRSASKQGNSSGVMEECLRRFESPAAHPPSGVGMDLAGSNCHGFGAGIDAATLPNWATSLISILGTSNGAMEEGLRRFESPVASPPAKQGKRKSATKHGNFNGAMEECLRRFKRQLLTEPDTLLE